MPKRRYVGGRTKTTNGREGYSVCAGLGEADGVFAFTVKRPAAGRQLGRHAGHPGLCVHSAGSVLLFSPCRQVLWLLLALRSASVPGWFNDVLLLHLSITPYLHPPLPPGVSSNCSFSSIFVCFFGAFKLSADLPHCCSSVCQLGLLMNVFGFHFCTKSLIINSIWWVLRASYGILRLRNKPPSRFLKWHWTLKLY